jgi:hypothetical protein
MKKIIKLTQKPKISNILLLAISISILFHTNVQAQFGLKNALKDKAEKILKETLKEKTSEKAASYDTLSFNYAIAFLDKTASFQNKQKDEGIIKTANFMLGEDERKTEQEKLRQLYDFANISYGLGNYFMTESYLRAAIIASQTTDTASNPIYYKSLGLLGVIYNNMGRFKSAEDFTIRALSGWERMQGEKSIGYLAEMSNLAVLRMNEGDYLKAEDLMSQLENKLLKIKEEQPLPYAIYINNKAILNQYMGRSAEALKYMKQCIAVSEESLSESNDT